MSITNFSYNHTLMDKNKQEIWKRHKGYIELLSKVNNSSVFVAEYKAGYIFLSDNFQLFGYDSQIINSQEIDPYYFEAKIHPDDREILSKVQNKLMDFILSLPVGQRKDYKHIYEFRAKNAGDDYMRIILQQQVLELDADGNPWLLLGIIDVSPDSSVFEQIKLRIINYKTGDVVPFSFIEQKSDIKLSEREKEILELARRGLQSKEISEKLFLSIHTVNKHRQNIMQKMNTNNVLEAIDYARKLGLLD